MSTRSDGHSKRSAAQTGDSSNWEPSGKPIVLWRFAPAEWVSSAPVVAAGVVYVGGDDGAVFALDAATGHMIWRFACGGSVDFSAAVAAGTVFVGSRDHNL